MLMLWGESDSSKISGFIPYTLAPSPAGPLPKFSSLLVTPFSIPLGLGSFCRSPWVLPPPFPPHLCSASRPDGPDGGLGLSAPLTLGTWVRGHRSGAAAPGPLPVAPNRSKWFDLIEPRRMPPDVTLLSLTTLMVAQGKSQPAR